MPAEDRSEQLGELDAQIANLRAAAKSLRDERPSWFEHVFHPGRQARRQAEFNATVVAALKEISGAIRRMTANAAECERHGSSLAAEIAQLRERSAGESAEAAQNVTEMRRRLDQLAREQAAKIDELVGSQGDLGNELRERIQHVLDEQRVAIRQLSLKASEDAVLSDRARRAAELKLEELAKRVPPPPA